MENRKLSFYKFIFAPALLVSALSRLPKARLIICNAFFTRGAGGGGGLFGYIGMCRAKGDVFLAILV